MTRPPFSFCICPDSSLLRNRIDDLLHAHPPAQGGEWRRFVFWADEGLPASFWEHLTLQGLFATPKALIVRNAQALPAESLRTLFAAMEALAPAKTRENKNVAPANPLVWPLICLEVGFEKGKAKVPAHILKQNAYLTAEKAGWLDSAPGLTPQGLPAYIRSEAARRGLCLERDRVNILASVLPPNAALVNSELDKLSLLADGKGRVPADAAGIVEQALELNVFELMRVLQRQDSAPAAWRRILEDRLSGETLIFAFNSILLREARLLWQTLAGPEPYLPPAAAAQKKALARSLGFEGIARLWELALAADKGVKSGERSPDQAFEMLAAALFMLFGNAAGGRA